MTRTGFGLAATVSFALASGMVAAQFAPAERPAPAEQASVEATQAVLMPRVESCADARAWVEAEETTEGVLYRLAKEELELCLALEARAAAMSAQPRR